MSVKRKVFYPVGFKKENLKDKKLLFVCWLCEGINTSFARFFVV